MMQQLAEKVARLGQRGVHEGSGASRPEALVTSFKRTATGALESKPLLLRWLMAKTALAEEEDQRKLRGGK